MRRTLCWIYSSEHVQVQWIQVVGDVPSAEFTTSTMLNLQLWTRSSRINPGRRGRALCWIYSSEHVQVQWIQVAGACTMLILQLWADPSPIGPEYRRRANTRYIPKLYQRYSPKLEEFKYLVFTRMPGESYRRRLRSSSLLLILFLLYLCDVFRALIISLVSTSPTGKCFRRPVSFWFNRSKQRHSQ